MLTRSLFLIMLFSACSFAVFAQTLSPIQTDRPDQTECPFITPAGYIQAELGFNYEQVKARYKNFLTPSALWKYGINEKLELRLITEIASAKDPSGKYTALSPVTVGFKTNLVKEKGIVPLISFIGHLTIPGLAGEKAKATYYAPAFRFTMQHTLSDKFSLGYNLGTEWDGETPEPVFIYTLTTGYVISGKMGSYIEVYGFAPQKGKADHRMDGGLTYLISNDVMMDVSGGCGLTENAPDYYASLGFSFRFNTKKTNN